MRVKTATTFLFIINIIIIIVYWKVRSGRLLPKRHYTKLTHSSKIKIIIKKNEDTRNNDKNSYYNVQ